MTELIRDVETIYTNAFESGDRTRAMKRLRVPPLEEKQSPMVTFRVGIFIGKLCVSGVCLNFSLQLYFTNSIRRNELYFITDGDYLYRRSG